LRPGRTGAPSVAPVPEETPADDLGIEVDEITPALRDRLQLDEDVTGVVVTDVDASSIAADKGIAPSMVITAVDDKPIRGIDDWNRAISKLDVGDIVMFEMRFGQQKLLVHFKVPEKH
jgi:serine protease Do